LSLVKVPESTVNISNIDKGYHAIAYFSLGLSWLLSFPISIHKKSVKYTIAISCVFYGIIIEVLQSTLTTYRTASLLDMLANAVGVFMALLIFKSVSEKINAI